MDLQRLRWTKNVKRSDDAWAYSQFKAGDLFKLAWKDNEANLVQELLNTFDRLTESERLELTLEILKRVVNLDFPPLSDEDLVLSAEGLFLELDEQEATDE